MVKIPKIRGQKKADPKNYEETITFRRYRRRGDRGLIELRDIVISIRPLRKSRAIKREIQWPGNISEDEIPRGKRYRGMEKIIYHRAGNPYEYEDSTREKVNYLLASKLEILFAAPRLQI